MNVDELLSRAWAAVKASGVPDALQETAFKEAIAVLKDGVSAGGGRQGQSRKKLSKLGSGLSDGAHSDDESVIDQDSFWKRLADESGVAEADLRDILQLDGDSKVHVTQPTRKLGANVAEQARAVIALVASARAIGLREQPVSADAVREELERKRCYQSNNFAAKHLGPLKGFNAGANRGQIVLTSKWVGDFAAAVEAAHGRSSAD